MAEERQLASRVAIVAASVSFCELVTAEISVRHPGRDTSKLVVSKLLCAQLPGRLQKAALRVSKRPSIIVIGSYGVFEES